MYIFLSIFLALVWSLILPVCPRAEVVGHFLKVEGQVDLLKQGKLPPKNPKVQEGVEPGDVIQTKTQGRAQLKFVDDSVLTIAPGSKVAIESYMYDAAKGSRKAVLQVFQGLVNTVVSQVFKVQEKPNFIMKTTTATLGVRGTNWYTLARRKRTDVYVESGRLSVSNINPKVLGEVFVNAMEHTQIQPDLTPDSPQPFQMQDLAPLQQQLGGDGSASSGEGGGGGSPGSGNTTPPASFGGTAPFSGGASGVPYSGDFSPLNYYSGSPAGPSSPSTESGIKQWTGGSGWWNDSGVPSGTSNWTSAGAPVSGNSAYLTQTDSMDRTVEYNSTSPVQLNELRIDATGSGNMTLEQLNSSNLTVNTEYVGYNGRGIFNQSGGVNTVNNLLALAANPGSSGTYNLQGGTLTAGTIDLNPGGSFNQTGGTLVAGSLNNAGTMALTGGVSTVTGAVTNQPPGQINIANNPAVFAGNVTNDGTVRTSNTTVTWAGNFINSGAYISDPATQYFTNLTISPTGFLVGGTKDQFIISNDFINQSVMNLSWNTVAADLTFTLGADNQHNLYVPGADLGSGSLGFQNNFAWGKLDLTGQILYLVDGNATLGGALYLGEILGVTLDGQLVTDIFGNGLNIYYDPNLPGNLYLHGLTYDLNGTQGGQLIPTPLPAGILLLGCGLLGLGLLGRRKKKADKFPL